MERNPGAELIRARGRAVAIAATAAFLATSISAHGQQHYRTSPQVVGSPPAAAPAPAPAAATGVAPGRTPASVAPAAPMPPPRPYQRSTPHGLRVDMPVVPDAENEIVVEFANALQGTNPQRLDQAAAQIAAKQAAPSPPAAPEESHETVVGF